MVQGEELCYLSGDWRIFQRVGGHRYSTEDVGYLYCVKLVMLAGMTITFHRW